ncbi:MAG: TldD/PmbA family protein, partial [Gemmatimonadaceae bacterium]|nr:TldD/PmbA family protein [Gloeobacterales cyanobacterium ES-bin-141]
MDPHQILELARALGAERAEIYQTSSFGRSANFEANRLKQVETGDEQGTALRVWCAGRPGLAVAHGPVDARLLAEKAIAISTFSKSEEADLASEGVAVESPLFVPTPIEQLIAWGEETIALVRERYPEILNSCTFTEEVGTVEIVNSAGLELCYQSFSRGGFLGAEWVRGEDFLQIYDGETVLETLSPSAIAAPVLQRLEWARKNSPSPKRSVPVLFTSKAVEVLLGTVTAALNGRQVLQQASPWSQLRGETVLSPLITLAQAPQLPPYITPFDDEGTRTMPLEFCTRGVLETFYADRRTARQLGLPYTGNGLRGGLGSYPQPGLFN